MATTVTNSPIVTGRKEISESALPDGAAFTVNQSVVTNTTTVDNSLGAVTTNYSYIPYMRKLDIDFVGYRMRPFRQVYCFFDDHNMSNFVERPNIIETNSSSSPVDIMTGHREHIAIGTAKARVLHKERNETTGNYRLYVSHFEGGTGSISVSDTVASQNGSGYSTTISGYTHSSGIARAYGADPNNGEWDTIQLAYDADSANTNFYNHLTIAIVTGPRAGQTSEIVAYNYSTRTASIHPKLGPDVVGEIYSISDNKVAYSVDDNQGMFVTPRGYISGVLHIPDPSDDILKIPTGDRIFRILDNSRNDLVNYTTRADYRFVSNGVNLNKAQLIEREETTTTENFIDFLLAPTPTPTPSPSASGTPTLTPTSTPGTSVSVTPSLSPSPSTSTSPTPTPTTTVTATPGASPKCCDALKDQRKAANYLTNRNLAGSTCNRFERLRPFVDQDLATLSTADKKKLIGYSNGGTYEWPWRWRYTDQNGVPYRGAPNRNEAYSSTKKVSGVRVPVDGGTIILGPWGDNKRCIGRGGENWSIASASGVTIGDANIKNTRFASANNPVNDPKEYYLSQWLKKWLPPKYVGGIYVTDLLCWTDLSKNCVKTRHDPIAETFYVDATTNKNGVFINSGNLFFKNKGDIPIEVQIRPVVNGYPSSDTIIPGATCVLQPEDINVASIPDAANTDTATRFQFPAPVYLNSGFDYALVVVSDDYAYDIFLAEKGKTILGTDRIVSEQPFLGSFFRSQDGSTWTAYQDEDLMFSLNRCNFSTSSGTIRMKEDKKQQVSVYDADKLYDAIHLRSDAIQLNETNMNYYFKGRSNNTQNMDGSYLTIKPENRIDLTDRKILKQASNTSFSSDIRIDLLSGDSRVSPSLFHNRQNLVLLENIISSSELRAENFVITNPGSGYTPGNVQIELTSSVGTGANVYANVSSAGEIANIALVSSGSGYVDDVTATVVAGGGSGAEIHVVTETGISGGPALTRYISKTVTLVDGFEAGDLRVYVTAVKPPGANVELYYKVRNPLDPEPIEKRNWVRLQQKTSPFLFSTNSEQIEYEYRPSLTANSITYTSDTTYRTFNQYAVKIVLTSKGTLSSDLPYVYDVRAIALPEDVY